MGVEYELHDTKNKRRFDLGKRAIGEYFFTNGTAAIRAAGEADLTEGLQKTWDNYVGVGLAMTPNPRYIPVLARLVWQFCEEADWQVYAISDAGDMNEEGWDWPCTHSRFDDETKINPWKFIK